MGRAYWQMARSLIGSQGRSMGPMGTGLDGTASRARAARYLSHCPLTNFEPDPAELDRKAGHSVAS